MRRLGGAEMEESEEVASETIEATAANAGTETEEPGGEDIE